MDTISLGVATRRRFLTRFGVLAGAGLALPLLQACGGGSPTATAPAAAPTIAAAPTTAAAAPTAAGAAAATAAPKPAAAAAASPAAAPTAAAQAAPATVASPTTAGATSGQIIGQINVADVKKYSGQTIHLAVQKHTATDAIQQMSPSFTQQTGINVNFEQIPQQQMDQKQLTDMSTGSGSYDVIGWFINPEYVENNWIYSVDELQQNANITDTKLLAMDDFFGKFLDYYRYKDKLWGLPFYGESLMMYYNADEFQKVGIDKAPNTVDELEQACQKIKAAGRMAGIALRGSSEGNSEIYPFLAWVYGYGGSWVDQASNEVGLDKPETIAAGDAWGHFMRDYAPPDVANYFWNEVQLAMQQEKAAIIMDATNFGPRLEDPAQSKITGKVGFAQLPEKLGSDGKPLGPAQTKGRFGYSDAAYALSVPRSSKQKEAAWLFSQWATSPDVMLQTTQLGLRADPTRRSSLESPKFAEKYNYGTGDGSFAKNLAGAFELAMPNYYPRLITGTQLGDTLGLALGQILTGQRSAKDAFAEAQQKSVDIQKQAGLLK